MKYVVPGQCFIPSVAGCSPCGQTAASPCSGRSPPPLARQRKGVCLSQADMPSPLPTTGLRADCTSSSVPQELCRWPFLLTRKVHCALLLLGDVRMPKGPLPQRNPLPSLAPPTPTPPSLNQPSMSQYQMACLLQLFDGQCDGVPSGLFLLTQNAKHAPHSCMLSASSALPAALTLHTQLMTCVRIWRCNTIH